MESNSDKKKVKLSSFTSDYVDNVENEDVAWVEKTIDSNVKMNPSSNVTTSRKYRSKNKSPSNSEDDEEMY